MTNDMNMLIRQTAGCPSGPSGPEPAQRVGLIGVGVGGGAAEPRPTRPSMDSWIRATADHKRERLADLAAYYEHERSNLP
jgi:hypothetical protein